MATRATERTCAKPPASTSTLVACEACRKLKMRCIRLGSGDGSTGATDPCERCKHNDRQCIIPEPRPLGRKHGAVGKYRGVEKAVRKIQAELRKAQPSADSFLNNPGLSEFVHGEREIREFLMPDVATPRAMALPNNARRGEEGHSTSPPQMPLRQSEPLPESNGVGNSRGEDETSDQDDDPISNPLGLVADASGEAIAQETQSVASPTSTISAANSNTLQRALTGELDTQNLARNLLQRPGYVSLGLTLSRESLELGLDTLFTHACQTRQYSDYFKPIDANQPQDTGPDLDPVELGLVSMEEAHFLFPMYFARLHPFNGILDPLLHTPDFVRSRSALLFTWILAITAQFDPTSGLLAKRLRLHGESLSKHVHSQGYKSVEIAQGYYISLLSATPAKSMSEERSWAYTTYAFGMAAELVQDYQSRTQKCLSSTRPMAATGLSLRPTHSNTPYHPNGITQQSHQKSTQDAHYPQRLVRNRERTWLRILLWDRAHSAARGRMTFFPETGITRHIEDWWKHPLANPVDRHTSAFILLRRQIATLHDEIKTQMEIPHENRHWVGELIDSALRPWRLSWLAHPDAILSLTDQISNLFLNYVYMHGRLWILSFALRGRTSRQVDANAIKEDCFEAAVKCCEIAVRDLQEIGEPIYCMLAPTWAMISYAAVLALKLFPMIHGNRPGYEVELLALVSQVALQLERAGTTPSHRFGIAALLGQHLFLILRMRANVLKELAKRGRDADHQMQASLSNDCQNVQTAGVNDLGINFQPEGFNDPYQLFDPLLPSFDPFLTGPILSGEEFAAPDDTFGEMISEWFGQGFGGVI